MQSQFNSIAQSLNLPMVCIFALIILVGWALFSASSNLIIRRIGFVLLIVVTLAILYITIFSRSRINASVHPVPFSTFQRAKVYSGLYIYMVLNMIMFMPVGFTLPFVLYGKPVKRILWTIFLGFLLSIFIEAIQEIFSIGYADIDDVIVNTLGTAIGSFSYLLSLMFTKLKKKS